MSKKNNRAMKEVKKKLSALQEVVERVIENQGEAITNNYGVLNYHCQPIGHLTICFRCMPWQKQRKSCNLFQSMSVARTKSLGLKSRSKSFKHTISPSKCYLIINSILVLLPRNHPKINGFF